MRPDSDNPTTGGSFIRDAKTGALTRVEEPDAPAPAESDQATAQTAKTDRKNAPAKSASDTKE